MQNIEAVGAVVPNPAHEAPTIRRLGSLSELTLGDQGNTDDMVGGANGDIGSSGPTG